MASIVNRKRKDGTTGYKVQWRLGGSRNGPWQSETFDDRRAAAKFQVQVEANGHRWPDGWVKGVGFSERVAPAEEIPLVEFGTAHIRRLTKAGPHTQTTYLKQVNRICAQLAAIKRETPTVQNVTTDDDQDWIVTRRKGGASPKTIANEHGLLSAIFKGAVKKGLIVRNPCEDVKLPALDDATETDDDKTFLTESEFRLLHDCIDEVDRDFLLVAVGTGLRWGELNALKVKDLDLDGAPATVSVRRAWKWNGRGEFKLEQHGRYYLGPPKTRESRRRITVAPRVVAALRRAIADKAPDDLVFGASGGGRVEHGNWYQSRWQRAIKKAQRDHGLTKTPRFHDLRHTHAAWLISAGVPLPVIQKRLGHKSIQITVDVYGGLLFQTHQVGVAHVVEKYHSTVGNMVGEYAGYGAFLPGGVGAAFGGLSLAGYAAAGNWRQVRSGAVGLVAGVVGGRLLKRAADAAWAYRGASRVVRSRVLRGIKRVSWARGAAYNMASYF